MTKQVRRDFFPERTYNTTDIARIAQVTLRQLQWWDERKVVSPQREGYGCAYRLEEGIEISVIAELRRKGLSLQKIRPVLRFLRHEMRRRLEDVLSPDSRFHLLTDGKSVYLEDRHERIIDLLKSARKPMFLVSIGDQVRRLEGIPRRTPDSQSSSGTRIGAGRPPKLSPDQVQLASQLLEQGKSVKDIARTFDVHEATIYRLASTL